MTLSPDYSTADAGTAGSTQFNAIIEPSDATNQTVTYTFPESIDGLSVDSTGLVTWTEAVPVGVYGVDVVTDDGGFTATGIVEIVTPDAGSGEG